MKTTYAFSHRMYELCDPTVDLMQNYIKCELRYAHVNYVTYIQSHSIYRRYAKQNVSLNN